MKLELGQFGRTKKGIIFQHNRLDLIPKGNFNAVTKASHNLIDLIEEGDYVNGNKIIKISTDFCGRNILIYGYDDGDRQVAITIYEDEIKSIVTKEQFKSIEYTVKE